jgi:hypothetical protein
MHGMNIKPTYIYIYVYLYSSQRTAVYFSNYCQIYFLKQRLSSNVKQNYWVQYINQQMHSKFKTGISSYMFRHLSPILRESTTTKEYKSNTPIQVMIVPTVIIWYSSWIVRLVDRASWIVRLVDRASWIVRLVDRASRIIWKTTKTVHCLSLVHWVITTPHVNSKV